MNNTLVVIEFYYLLACFLFFFKMDKKDLKIVSENKSMWTSHLSNVVCAAPESKQLQENGYVF